MSRGFLHSLILGCLFSGSVYGISSTGPVYTTDFGSNDVYAINPQTGTHELLTTIPGSVGDLVDVAVLNKTTLYALNSQDSTIYSVDAQTGASQLVTQTPIDSISEDLYGFALADDSTAYAVGYGTGNIYSIDLKTGASSLLATVGEAPGLTDIIIGNDSTAYAVAYNINEIYSVNLQTGAYQIVTPISVGFPETPAIEGIGLLNNTTAYVVGNQNSTVYEVDLQTGASKPVGTIAGTPALTNVGFPNETTLYTINDGGDQFYTFNLLNGTSSVVTTIPGVSGLAGIGLLLQIGNDPLTGNNLKLVRYLNDQAPIDTIRLFALLTNSQLPSALQAAAPTRNAFATFASQNGYMASAQVVADHGRQRRFHLRQKSPVEMAAAGIPVDELQANASHEIQPSQNGGSCKTDLHTIWMAGFGEYAREKSQHQTPAFKAGVGGAIVGLDFNHMGPHVLGVGGAYVYTHIHEDDNAGHADVNQGYLTLYGTLNASKWYVDLGIWGGYYHIDNHRKIAFPSFNATVSSTTNGWQLAPHFEVGYDGFRLDGCTLKWLGFEPFLMADWVINWEKGFKEHGAAMLNMGQKGRTSSLFRGESGLRINEIATFGWGSLVFTEKASYAYQKAFHTGRINAFLIGSPGSFTVDTLTTAQNLGVAEFSMLFVFGCQKSSYLDIWYQGEFGSRYQSHQGVIEIGKDF